MNNLTTKQADLRESYILGLLGKSHDDFMRFRDIEVTDDHIIVYTRCGGFHQRETYKEMYDEMRKHPLYLFDEDDEDDFTYSEIYFAHPPLAKEILNGIKNGKVIFSNDGKAITFDMKITGNI